ncbi:clr6 l associated factor 1 laf1 [Gigaspora margarita]|uniref:Clr6 l associated factor 1 laf1 n=1 Tax=Gigaspora margarita TaxID=4874 RepID=A0A8H3X9T8_GIGMA|nr:clr6 l associated factor 1 laf1 [Gigaspora margarita]
MTLPYQHNNSPFVSSMMSPPPSPKKSVDINTLENLEKPALSREINTLSILNETTTKEQPKEQTKELVKPKSRPKSRFRMYICEAPPELLELIKRSEIQKSTKNSNNSNNSNNANNANNTNNTVKSKPINAITAATVNQVPKPKPKNEHMTGDNHMTIIQKSNHRNHHHRIRKNPYPIKSPTKSSPGITLKLDVFTPFKEDPMALLHINKPYQTLTSECSTPSLTSITSSSPESTPPSSPSPPTRQNMDKKQQRKKQIKINKKNHTTSVERKRKSNSLARVMADRGLLDTSFNTVTSGEIKSIRLPPPPPLEWDKLIENINEMRLDNNILNNIIPKITWKGQPLTISHLPHFNALHRKEVEVASTLRLTPVQYLTAKHTLVSAAQRYVQKSLPFRKSDAQKLLRIDVNKASKLWEFFQQVKWI